MQIYFSVDLIIFTSNYYTAAYSLDKSKNGEHVSLWNLITFK